MKLIIGGAYQGKKEYVQRKYHIEESQIWQGGYPIPGENWRCVNSLHNIIKQCMESETCEDSQQKILACIRQLIDKISDVIIICDEVGGGIVPVDKGEREYRECVGQILCELAKEADTVERVYCGIGQTIKSTVYISLIRHGSTEENLAKKYVGITDAVLCEAGREALKRRKDKGLYPASESGLTERFTICPVGKQICAGSQSGCSDKQACDDRQKSIPPVEAVITSPMKRCLETAQILYHNITPVICEDFRETDFGIFEGKNYDELMQDDSIAPLYQAWIDEGGRLPFPEGESMEQMKKRCIGAFEGLLSELASHLHTAMILHGGTIMSIVSAFAAPMQDSSGTSHPDFYDYQCENGTGYLCRLELTGDQKVHRMYCVGRLGVQSDA